MMPGRELGDELLNQWREVRAAVAQGWDGEGDSLNAVEEIGSKRAATHFLVERP
jgi:hypothetical protein